jgi:ABC-type transport system involved in multi-copper enzyme maturation permease subunit
MKKQQIRKRIGYIFLSISIVLIALLFLPFRLVDPETHQLFELISLWFIFACLLISAPCLLNRIWLRIISAIPFALCVFGYPILIVLSSIAGGPISGYELLDELQLSHSKVVAYRINGGATTDFRIKIVQEMKVLPNIVLTRTLHDGYHEYEASLKTAANNLVITCVDGNTTELKLKSRIYF